MPCIYEDIFNPIFTLIFRKARIASLDTYILAPSFNGDTELSINQTPLLRLPQSKEDQEKLDYQHTFKLISLPIHKIFFTLSNKYKLQMSSSLKANIFAEILALDSVFLHDDSPLVEFENYYSPLEDAGYPMKDINEFWNPPLTKLGINTEGFIEVETQQEERYPSITLLIREDYSSWFKSWRNANLKRLTDKSFIELYDLSVNLLDSFQSKELDYKLKGKSSNTLTLEIDLSTSTHNPNLTREQLIELLIYLRDRKVISILDSSNNSVLKIQTSNIEHLKYLLKRLRSTRSYLFKIEVADINPFDDIQDLSQTIFQVILKVTEEHKHIVQVKDWIANSIYQIHVFEKEMAMAGQLFQLVYEKAKSQEEINISNAQKEIRNKYPEIKLRKASASQFIRDWKLNIMDDVFFPVRENNRLKLRIKYTLADLISGADTNDPKALNNYYQTLSSKLRQAAK